MQVPVFRSIAKPVYWGGLPRGILICLIIFTGVAFFIFKSLYVVIPTTLLYYILKLIVREDRRVFGILRQNFKLKSYYYPD